MLSTGPGHYVAANKILAISGRNSNGHLPNPLSRQIQDAWATGKVIDHTGGRAINSVIHLEGGYLVLSHVRVETLAKGWTRLKRSEFMWKPTALEGVVKPWRYIGRFM